jgi:formate C-acetyltransferase
VYLLNELKKQVGERPEGMLIRNWLLAKGFRQYLNHPIAMIRAYGIQALLTEHEKYIYPSDYIAGSIRGLISSDITPEELNHASELVRSFGQNYFTTNSDHFAPDYEGFLAEGISGVRSRIAKSMKIHKEDPDHEKKITLLKAMDISMAALSRMLEQYSEKAEKLAASAETDEQYQRMLEIAETCRAVSAEPPKTFRQALQLLWMTHISFVYEGRYAMALGRLDQILYPFYARDKAEGILTDDQVLEWLSCTFYKIIEQRYFGGDDVVNIAIGGLKPEGSDAVNELSYLILYAVRDCNIPGPNLSARWHSRVSEKLIEECLKVIGTGLGYPALMNDEVNIPALQRHGYSLEDSRNHCFVGCIENFIPGKQPPWTDGRYNIPKFLELALNRGQCMQTGIQMGQETSDAEHMLIMDDFMDALRCQSEYGAAEYMTFFLNENDRYNRSRYIQPYLSCFCRDCIERALDINDGGAMYPSVHGVACMGLATMVDSLAAIEQVIYNKKIATLARLRDALKVRGNI